MSIHSPSRLLIAATVLAGIAIAGCGSQTSNSASPPAQEKPVGAALVEKGEKVFASMGCVACHQEGDSGQGANLRGIAGKEVTLADGRTVMRDDEYFVRSIHEPATDVVPGSPLSMPPYSNIQGEDLKALVTYLQSLN